MPVEKGDGVASRTPVALGVKPGKSPQAKLKPQRKAPNFRAQVVKWALWGVSNEPEIHYAETRPMPLTDALPLTTDCSGFATLCAKLAGAPDPNGRGFDGEGYTGTLLTHCRHIPFSEVQPGDLVIYGPAPGHHVCVVIQVLKGDLELVSHGQESGPAKILHSVEQRYQPLPAQFLSFL